MYLKKDNLRRYEKSKSICGQPLLLPTLKRFDIIKFLELEKLPFELNIPTDLETLFFKACTKMVEIVVVDESKMNNVNTQKGLYFA